MAAHISANEQRVLGEIERIGAAARNEALVLDILNPGSTATTYSDVHEAFKKLTFRIHPNRGGNITPGQATDTVAIVTRAQTRGGRPHKRHNVLYQTKRASNLARTNKRRAPRHKTWHASKQ